MSRRDLEGSDLVLTEVLSQHLSEETKKTTKISTRTTMSWSRFTTNIQNTNQDCDCYVAAVITSVISKMLGLS
jgi:hypothetical protein